MADAQATEAAAVAPPPGQAAAALGGGLTGDQPKGDLVSDARAAGFSDNEIGDWVNEQKPTFKAAGFNDQEIDSYFSGLQKPGKVPPSLLDRLRGAFSSDTAPMQERAGFGGAVSRGFEQGAGSGPSETSEKMISEAREIGMFPPAGKTGNPLQFANEAVLGNALKATDSFFRIINGAFSAAGAGGGRVMANAGEQLGHPVDTAYNLMTGESQIKSTPEYEEQEARKAEAAGIDLTNAYILSEMASPFSRAAPIESAERLRAQREIARAGTVDQTVGYLPKSQDFTDAAKIVGNGEVAPGVRQKIVDLYEKDGIHPAEIAHDEQIDPDVRTALNDPDPNVLPKRYVAGGARPLVVDPAADISDGASAMAKKAVIDDVYGKLRNAGLSDEEANANAQLWGARYAARSQALTGRADNAYRLYEGEGLDVRKGAEPVPFAEAAEQGARPLEPGLFAEREAEGQMVLPGAERIGQGELAQRGAEAPLTPTVGQKPLDIGLFSDEAKQRELFQGEAAAPRGRIIFDTNRAIIEMFASADRSTFPHEASHLWLDELIRDASSEQALPQLKADLQTVMDWFGVKKPDEITAAHHEQWAEGFERYLAEGKAPTPMLQRMFDTFKRWLIDIYKTLNEIGAPISDEVRGVYDRLLRAPETAAAKFEPREPMVSEAVPETQGKGRAAIDEIPATPGGEASQNEREALLGPVGNNIPAEATIASMFDRLLPDPLARAIGMRQDMGLPPLDSMEEARAAFLRDFADFKERYSQPIDINTPEAIERQKRIARTLSEQNGYAEPGKGVPIAQDRRAVIVLGPSAGGKSTHADALVKDRSAMLIDSDEAKRLLSTDRRNDAQNHEESSRISEEMLIPHAIEHGNNFVMPIVGKNLTKINNMIDTLAANGYTTEVHLVSLPLETALQRMLLRYISRGRMIDPVYLADIDHRPEQTFDVLKSRPAVAAAVRYDADVPRGSAYRVLEAVRNPDTGLGRSAVERTGLGAGEGEGAAGSAGAGQAGRPALLRPVEDSAIPNGIASFAPGQLTVDAKRFQFKDATDEAGVSERLKGVSKWDPIKAGTALVWQDNAGQSFVVDGHQRYALAQRIKATDPNADVRLNAHVLKESDGVTAEEARAIAASKNIAEGTGTAVDAAKIFRDRPDLIKDLPPRSELVRQARGLANLGDNAFGAVINEVVPANYAAIVGRLVPEDAALQSALIDLLAKTEPANAAQAETIVRQGINAGFERQVTADMFGEQEVAHSLFSERAKVLDRAQKLLRRDKTVFSVLTKEQEQIEAAGNKLAAEINAKRAAADAQALQLLQVLATRTGAISDALTKAAKDAKGSGNYSTAAKEFVAELRRQAESGDLARAADGTARGPIHVGNENTGLSIEAPAERTGAADERTAGNEIAGILDRAAKAPEGIPPPALAEEPRMFEQRGKRNAGGPVFDFIHNADLMDLRRDKLFSYDDRGGFRKAFDAGVNSWKTTFQPHLISDVALKADAMFAKAKSRQAMGHDQAQASMEADYQWWRDRTPIEKQAFYLAAQRGQVMTAEMAARWRGYHAMLDYAYQLEEQRGSKAYYIEHYLPDLWQDPQKARQFFANRMKMLGPTWYQKERAFQFREEGIAAGLRPLYDNPADEVMHRLFASADMIERMDLLKRLKDELNAAVESKEANPNLQFQGWQEIVAPNRDKWMLSPDIMPLYTNGLEAKGLWQMEGYGGKFFHGWMKFKNAWVPVKLSLSAFHPLHVMQINWNQGLALAFTHVLQGGDPVEAMKYAAEGFYGPLLAAPGASIGAGVGGTIGYLASTAMTPVGATLGGVAGFLGGKGMVGRTTGAAIGAGIGSVATPFTLLGAGVGAIAGAKTFGMLERMGLITRPTTEGRWAREAWLKPESQRTPQEQAAVTLINEMGISAQLSEQLRVAAKRNLETALDSGQWYKAIVPAMRRAIEVMQAPIFEKWIPDLKVSAALNQAHALLARRPDLIDNDIQRGIALRQIGKSIDDRFGEMFYGSLFWNRYVKDAGIGAFLSLGWNAGGLRQFGGSIAEPIARGVRRVVRGPATESEQTVAYAQNKATWAFAYVASSMLTVGLMSYLMSGEPPEGLDWFLPRTGEKNPDGTDHRLSQMSYTRDYVMAKKHIEERGGGVTGTVFGLGDMLSNKFLVQPFSEMLANKDYYGNEIFDPNAKLYQQGVELIAHFFGDQFNPMSISGYNRSLENGISRPTAALSFLGFGPAPAYAERDATQNRIYYLYGLRNGGTRPFDEAIKKGGEGIEAYLAGRTPQEGLMELRGEIMLARQRQDWPTAAKAEQEYLKLGGSRQSLHNIILGIGGDITLFRQLPESDQKAVLEAAPPAARAKYEPYAKTHAARDVADLMAQAGDAKQRGDMTAATRLEAQAQARIQQGIAKGEIENQDTFKRQLSQELIDRHSPELGAILSVPKQKRKEFLPRIAPQLRQQQGLQ